jgi:hypothetical protein
MAERNMCSRKQRSKRGSGFVIFYNALINVAPLFYYSDICFYLSELYNKISSIETTNTLIGFVASIVPRGTGNAP